MVQKARHRAEGSDWAVKVVENKSLEDDENLEALETEIEILRKLDHPHIVGLKEVVVTRSDTYLVMELLSGGELFNRIVDEGRFTEEAAADLFAQILLSMNYLHSLDIVHRDVKPENILYMEEGSSKIKLIDFGYAGVWAPDKPLTGLCGTPDYVAPEVLTWYEDDENGTPYGKSSDLWSLGVLLYVILSGCSPFSADEEEAILQLVAEAKFEFHDAEWKEISPEAKDLISQLLVVDPQKRLTMEALLAHKWLAKAVESSRASIAAAVAAKAAPPPQRAAKAAVAASAEPPPPPPHSNGVPPAAPKDAAPPQPEIHPRVEGLPPGGVKGACPAGTLL